MTMDITCEQKHFFEGIKKEAFFEKKQTFQFEIGKYHVVLEVSSCLNIGSCAN